MKSPYEYTLGELSLMARIAKPDSTIESYHIQSLLKFVSEWQKKDLELKTKRDAAKVSQREKELIENSRDQKRMDKDVLNQCKLEGF